MSDLTLTFHHSAGLSLLRLSGDVLTADLTRLRHALRTNIIGGSRRLIIDLHDARYDPAQLRALLTLFESVLDAENVAGVVSANPLLRRQVSVSPLNWRCSVYASLEEAIALSERRQDPAARESVYDAARALER